MKRAGESFPPQRAGGGEQVAALLPATAPVPEPARRIGFIKGLLLFWLMPKRYGPHLAVGSIWRALGAHLVGLLFLAGLVLVGTFAGDIVRHLQEEGLAFSPGAAADSLLLRLRITAAKIVLELASSTLTLGGAGPAASTFGWAATLSEPAILVLAVVVMPWCAGGDRAGSVFKRSLKNIYWSTTLSIPVAVAWGPLIVLSEYIDGRWFAYMPEMLALAVACLLLVLPLVLFVRILIVGAGRYVGETVGPAFGPREPRCDECGYLIIGLPMEAKCPECATPVRDSLPGGRRKPTEWEESEFGARAVVVLLRMQWRVLRDADFFKELRVQSGLAAARHFWWASFLLIVLILLAVLRLAVMVSSNDEAIMVLAPVAVLATCVPFVAQAATMLITCFQAQSRLGIQDYRISAIACYYATPLMWPLMIVLLAVGLFVTSQTGYEVMFEWHTRVAGERIDGWVVVLGLGLSVVIAALWFWWRRLHRGLGAVRYANV